MADLKTIFIIMLMINIGTMLVFKSGMVEDPFLIEAGTRAGDSLSGFVSTNGDYSSSGNVNFSSSVLGVSDIARPVTEEASSTETVLFKNDNPFAMILDLMLLILGTLVFGMIAILISAQAPVYVIFMIGVPLTLIYVFSAISFIRSGS